MNEYWQTVETLERYIKSARPEQAEKTLPLLYEIKFVGYFNPKFREETIDKLDEILDQLFIEIHGDGDAT